MAKVVINSLEEFRQYEGKEIGVSDFHQITQDQINKFAESTLDYQWIHVDEERAKTESPFKSTIAHGYLTMSLLPYLWYQIVEVNNLKMMVNYGIEKLRFQQAVKVNDKVRVRATVDSIKDLRGITKVQMKIVLEIEGSRKPAYDAEIIFLYHFNN